LFIQRPLNLIETSVSKVQKIARSQLALGRYNVQLISLPVNGWLALRVPKEWEPELPLDTKKKGLWQSPPVSPKMRSITSGLNSFPISDKFILGWIRYGRHSAERTGNSPADD
jgi:hypothetical protein